ncbi:enoyl-CoA hydratase [Rhizobium leguminosarum]|uniref:enoyl-CoA hydratase n=1 Tax=Rhizobium leguminosarum TaxID=384 RepID=UPI001C97FADB|nr:enoyl-CoA hydratase [Rhizobium leguminosarum]MBY5666788.1 enoyl-CoA hydratase [Rhizobium leguminosarum]MBY5680391.1 enoyl-CoA hydratase [Rhizobium leguminosarum]
MDDIVVEHFEGVLRVELNRPEKMNAMTSSMYLKLADIFDDAAKDETVRVVLWHGAGDAFTAGNDVKDFLQNPPGAEESPQARLMNALVEFDKPLIAAVHGVAIGGGTTMLLHCDFVYAAQKTKFQMPFINLAVVPEFGSSCLLPQAIGHIRASDLILLGSSFDAVRAQELGLVTEVVPHETVLAVATETARHLAAKPAGALQASKRLLKQPFLQQIRAAMKAENEAFSVQVHSDEAKEALTAFLEKRPADFSKTRQNIAAE